MPAKAHRTTDGSSPELRRSSLAHCSSILLLLSPFPASSLHASTALTPPANAVSAPSGAGAKVATTSVQRYVLRGSTVLPQDEIDRITRVATGSSVDLSHIREALAHLQKSYRDRGFPNATLRLPRQLLSDGVLHIDVSEGAPSPTKLPSVGAGVSPGGIPSNETKPPAPPERTFEVRHYEVLGNTVLPAETVDGAFTNAVGAQVSLSQVQQALGALQLAYRERGFATVSVGLPQQQITNATIKVQVTEGVLSDIRVTGNRHFSSNNIVRALPSLKTNELLNSRVFQRELDSANQNRDRQIFPVLGPGAEPGTSSLTLRVKDRLPLHGRIEVNNHNTPGTPDWRLNSSAQYNNLWQLDHQLGLSYGFTPEEFKQGDLSPDYLLNRPLIANLGAYYRLPFGAPESVSERIAGSGGFGFDEATRQFRLPPAGGQPDLTFFASASSIDTGVQYGPARTVSQTPLLTIVSQDTGQNLSLNESVGARFNLPLALGRTDTRRFGLSGGIDGRHFGLESFNTNNFIITTVVTNAQGSQTIESRVSSPQPARKNHVNYLPLVAALDFAQTDRTGSTTANLSLAGNVTDDAENFRQLSYSQETDSLYAKLNLSLARDQKLSGDWSLLARAAGQVATGPLLGIEQFSVGGLNSVRGYYEGDEFGDHGWFGSLELRSPFLQERVPVGSDFAPVWLRGTAFVDAGQRILSDAPVAARSVRTLMGAGFGVSANLNNRVDLRIVVGWPLFETLNTESGDPRVYFSLGGQF
jgi:hemolysin activation/secretion protein